VYRKTEEALIGTSCEEKCFALASHEHPKLELSWDRGVFHGLQPDRQPRGRADGSTPAVSRRLPANLTSKSAMSVRAVTAYDRGSGISPSRSNAASQCSRQAKPWSAPGSARRGSARMRPVPKVQPASESCRAQTAPSFGTCSTGLPLGDTIASFEPQHHNLETLELFAKTRQELLPSPLPDPNACDQADRTTNVLNHPVQLPQLQTPLSPDTRTPPPHTHWASPSHMSKLPEASSPVPTGFNLLVPVLTKQSGNQPFSSDSPESLSNSINASLGLSIPSGFFSDDVVATADILGASCTSGYDSFPSSPNSKLHPYARQEKQPGLALELSDVYFKRKVV